MRIQKNTPVKLKTFLGTVNAPNDVEISENYWKLIGQSGTVIDDQLLDKGKVLILFKRNLDELGLENHNPIKNTLRISKSDLELDRLEIYNQKLNKEISKRTSYMNNTKWYKVFSELRNKNLFFNTAQIKLLISDNTYKFSFDESENFNEKGFGDSGSGPFDFKEIEWILIERQYEIERSNRTEKLQPIIISQPINEIEKALNSIGQLEYEIDEDEYKLYGYK